MVIYKDNYDISPIADQIMGYDVTNNEIREYNDVQILLAEKNSKSSHVTRDDDGVWLYFIFSDNSKLCFLIALFKKA